MTADADLAGAAYPEMLERGIDLFDAAAGLSDPRRAVLVYRYLATQMGSATCAAVVGAPETRGWTMDTVWIFLSSVAEEDKEKHPWAKVWDHDERGGVSGLLGLAGSMPEGFLTDEEARAFYDAL